MSRSPDQSETIYAQQARLLLGVAKVPHRKKTAAAVLASDAGEVIERSTWRNLHRLLRDALTEVGFDWTNTACGLGQSSEFYASMERHLESALRIRRDSPATLRELHIITGDEKTPSQIFVLSLDEEEFRKFAGILLGP